LRFWSGSPLSAWACADAAHPETAIAIAAVAVINRRCIENLLHFAEVRARKGAKLGPLAKNGR
jgi:hypothetical protein